MEISEVGGISRMTEIPRDIKKRIFVFTALIDMPGTGTENVCTLSEPDEEGMRYVQINGQDMGKGILLGSVGPGYLGECPAVKIGNRLNLRLSEPLGFENTRVLGLIKAIFVAEGENKRRVKKGSRVKWEDIELTIENFIQEAINGIGGTENAEY